MSVQREVEAAIEALTGEVTTVRGASRTDSGVHARGQIAAFDTSRPLPTLGWVRGLNGKLPQDVAVREAEFCTAGYDPRFDALRKNYRYVIHTGIERDPIDRHRAWHLGPRRAQPRPGGRGPILDVDAMRAAVPHFVGTHDFRAFRSSRDARDNTIRTIEEARVTCPWSGSDDLVAFEVRGNAFLQHMVRIMAGTLVEVGRKRIAPSTIPELLRSDAERDDAGPTAPPHGLCLMSIQLGRKRAARVGDSGSR